MGMTINAIMHRIASVFDCVRALSMAVPAHYQVTVSKFHFAWVCVVCVGRHDSAPVVILLVVVSLSVLYVCIVYCCTCKCG